ncbi:MAG: hypothetical protein HZB26_14360 [Candidatus Hydrogenedentes bacterium]|nr:hypothetical protein [Candidatus Hydrogenedentota bacterium]
MTPVNSYPEMHDVGPNCNLVLWLHEYKDEQETPDPWSVEKIYNVPFYLPDPSQDSLFRLLNDRIDAACANGYISPTRLGLVHDILQEYFTGNFPSKDHSMAEVMSGQYALPAADAIIHLRLKDVGIYLPHNHVDPSEAPAINTLLFTKPTLWNCSYPPNPAGVARFGDITLRQLHGTALKDLFNSCPDTYKMLRRAIEAHVFRPNPAYPFGPDPTTARSWDYKPKDRIRIRVKSNNKCCMNGNCQDAMNPALYCGSTNGDPNGPCNAMSDPCV